MDVQDGVGGRTVRGARSCAHPATAALVRQLIDDFNEAPDSAALVARVLHSAVTETRSDRGIVSWIDGNEMLVAGCHDPFGEPVEVGSRWPLASGQVTAVALSKGWPQGLWLDSDSMTLVRASPEVPASDGGTGHGLVAPVQVGGEHVAILCVSRRRAEDFSPAERAVLDVVAQVAAQPLRAARLEDLLASTRVELADHLGGRESVERVKTDVLRLASHELRSPLTVLHGYLSLIRGGFFGDIPAPLDDVMRILERRTAEMNGLVNDMLVAARVDDHAPAAPETVDVRELVRQAVASIAPRVPSQHRVRVELADQPLLVRVDPERVALAIRNVIDNAVKYSPAGGDVICCVSGDGATVRVRVADHGLGIAPEDRDKLFSRFGRILTSANSHIPGIGLGLFFAREVARRHGGDVSLVERDGPGTTFELSLPLAQ